TEARNEQWAEFESEAQRPQPISEDEWSPEASIDVRPGDDENSEADTVILESAPTDDLGQDMADEGEEVSFLPPPVTMLINSVRRRFSDKMTVI
ncbi:unnamed protein product, partial [Penicillium palitans]